MRQILAALAATAMLAAGHVNADTLAPAPQIIAEYDRSFIERFGAQTFGELLDTGIVRYFFTGGRDLLILVNGRPYATTAHNLDTIPLSAVERIEVLRAESLGIHGGHAAVRGAFNLVLRNDLDGFDVRAVTRMPSRDGGEARQGSVVWGGAIGDGGYLAIGVDILDRQEIAGRTREHSRSEWTEGGSFADAKNVSIGGNTVLIFDKSTKELRAVPLGSCDQALGYTGPLSNPSGIESGDKGCGFAYGNLWWDSPSYDQRNAILNLSHPLGERAELHVDANVTHGRTAFRYAPSIGVFSVTPGEKLLDAINEAARKADPPFEATTDNIFSVGHRFIAHGNRDWNWSTEEYDASASIRGRLTERLGYDARIEAYQFDYSLSGDTFVDAETIRREILAGRYDLANPLSAEPDHLAAIERSSLREEDDIGSRYLGTRLALEGAGPGIGGRTAAWTAGVELGSGEVHRLLAFRANDGRTRDVHGVLGSGGTSYAGERDAAGAFAEVSLPLADAVDVRAAARADELDDVGGLRAWRLGVEYRPNDIVTLRSSWSAGDGAPAMFHLHSTAAQDHPYVRCIPESGPAPRTCDTSNYRQVTRLTTGNPELKPSGSERHSIGAEARKGPFYLVVDWYRLTTSELAGQHDATWAMLNHPECPPGGGSNCIERVAGDITIHDSFANIVSNEISGINTRFGVRTETGWGFVAMRGFWRYVIDSDEHIAGEEQPFPLPRNAVRIVTSAGRGDLTVSWALNYRDEIENRLGDGQFSSWTGHDMTLDWKKPLQLENMRLTAGVYNVTDTKLSTNTAHPSAADGPRAAGWGRTFFAILNMHF